MSKEELNKLKFELSYGFLIDKINEIELKINDIYSKNIMFLKLKENNLNKMFEELLKESNKLIELESNLMKLLQNTQKLYNVINLISKETTDNKVVFQFKDEEEKEAFLHSLNERNKLLFEYKKKIYDSEKLNESINERIDDYIYSLSTSV